MSLDNGTSHANCSEYDIWLPPTAKVFLGSINGKYLALLIIGSLGTSAIIVLGFIHWYFVHNFVSARSRRTFLYWFCGLFPVAAICCLLGLLMPRAASFLFAVAWIYIMVCLVKLIRLMYQLFDGRKAMSKCLLDSKKKISFAVPPYCCCFKFLPEAEPTERNLRWIGWFVLQTLVVRIILLTVGVIGVIELQEDSAQLVNIVQILVAISMVFASFGSHALCILAKEKLAPYRFMTLFGLLDVTMTLFGLQQLICNVLIDFDIYSCDWNGFLLICEMLALSILTTFLLQPTKTALFDRHPSQIADREVPESVRTGM